MDSTTGDSYLFPGQQWLDKNRGDKRLSRTFVSGKLRNFVYSYFMQLYLLSVYYGVQISIKHFESPQYATNPYITLQTTTLLLKFLHYAPNSYIRPRILISLPPFLYHSKFLRHNLNPYITPEITICTPVP